MGNILKAISMMLISIIGIGIVAYSISTTPPDTSINCDDQICTTGVIAQVVDGDTVKFLSDSGEEIRIRLALVNAPERTEPGGDESKAFAVSQCSTGSESVFILDRGQKPSFDREIGLVFCSETSLNELLLENDHAELDPRFCGRSEFGGLDWALKYGCD
ncbi:thermonuclease family protein [Candidatus Nitrosopelagicus sp.]|nr:thermonuclease family protein [Candidatus Nitrosopelagicus sp.]